MSEQQSVATYLTTLDIGTTKICVLIAEILPSGEVRVAGFGEHPSYGLKKGVVVNINSTVESIKRAVQDAEAQAGVCVEQAVVGIAGSHIKSFNSSGVVGIKRRDVTQHDIDRVIEAAKAVPLPQDREILHVLPQHFRVDGQEVVQESLGMFGVRLEADVHIVTGAVAAVQNIVKACEMANIRVSDIVLEQLASAQAVLTPSEQELGVGIIDIGGGTADFAVYKEGRIRHSRVFPIAGSHFTNDIAIGLGIPLQHAEDLKKKYASVTDEAFTKLVDKQVTIPLDYEGGSKKIDTYSLLEIVRPRAEEIFAFLHDEIVQNRLACHMPAGLVLTGGGALLRGLPELVQTMLNTPVRVGLPRYYFQPPAEHTVDERLHSPVYATVYGLLAFALQPNHTLMHTPADTPLLAKVFMRMKSWIYDLI